MEKIFSNNTKVKFNFNYFKNRTPKELKNHFHTCIIKSVRKIINNKFDCELKDMMRYFYAFDYLIKMIRDYKEHKNFGNIKLKKKRYKFNPKLLIKNKQLSVERISIYKNHLVNKVLLNKSGIKNFLNFINFNNFNVNNVPWLFSLIVKSKLINNCKKFLEIGNNINKAHNKKIQNYLEDNSIYIFFIVMFFNKEIE